VLHFRRREANCDEAVVQPRIPMAPNSMSDTVVGPATVNGKRKGKALVGASDPVIGSREMFTLIREHAGRRGAVTPASQHISEAP
jgi:hypothetical protein